LDPEYTIETQKGWANQEHKVQGGESLVELKKRAYEGTMRIASIAKAQIIYLISHGTLIEMLCSKVGARQALQRNVENMKFLDYAIFEFRDGALSIKKDINRWNQD
jgi:broad specificity phosphatase PhoE